MKVVSFFHLKEVRWAIPEQEIAAIRAELPQVEICSVEDEADLPAAIADADAFVGWILPARAFAHAKRLRWVHSANAGVEAILYPEMVESDVVLTNGAGLHSVSIPEHVLGMMLAFSRNLHQALRVQARGQWDRFGVIVFGGGIRELAGSNLAIFGAGAIGRSLALLAAGLGMNVRVLRRRPDKPVPGAEAVVGPQDKLALLSWADFVVLATPSTPETVNLIDREALRAMKSSAYLINVARGDAIDDEALVEALRSGAIAGAGLDAFREEPLPPSSPYWSMENVILTPHVSGYTSDYFGRTLELFRDNLRRFVNSEPLRNVVNKRLGYVEE
ncbi:MAG TPA: D-2-hydroxyacid dehydrogenase [Candidatus Binatia bacterium]